MSELNPFYTQAADFLADLKAEQEAPLAELLGRVYESAFAEGKRCEQDRIRQALVKLRTYFVGTGPDDEEMAILLGEALDAVTLNIVPM